MKRIWLLAATGLLFFSVSGGFAGNRETEMQNKTLGSTMKIEDQDWRKSENAEV